MTSHAWHRVIDDVARDMTAGDPAPDFRVRVMERVSTTPPSRPLLAFVGSWRGATTAAAVAATAIALNVSQPFRGPEPPHSVARGGSIAAPVVAPSDPATSVEAPGPAAARPAPAPQPPAALVEWRARNIPALADVAALDIASIQPPGLSISQLSVTPLDIAPIVVPSIRRSTVGGRYRRLHAPIVFDCSARHSSGRADRGAAGTAASASAPAGSAHHCHSASATAAGARWWRGTPTGGRSTAGQQPGQPPAQAGRGARWEPPSQNIKIEVTITDLAEKTTKKVVSMLVGDGHNGRIRSQGQGVLNVDGQGQATADSRVYLQITIEYMPDRSATITNINQSISLMLVAGKPTLISQSADPGTDRKVTVEVTATVVK